MTIYAFNDFNPQSAPDPTLSLGNGRLFTLFCALPDSHSETDDLHTHNHFFAFFFDAAASSAAERFSAFNFPRKLLDFRVHVAHDLVLLPSLPTIAPHPPKVSSSSPLH
jgi:hypothetical protein